MRDRNQDKSTKLQIIIERVDLAICTLLNLNDVLNTNNIAELLTQFRLYSSMVTKEIRGAFERCKALTGNKGRAKTYLAENTLLYLCEIGYKWKDIVAMFLVSRWTLFRQAKKFGLESLTGFSNISEKKLD